MTHTIGMISLGCAKNQVNAEHMLWLLRQAGYEISPDPDGAELVIVNTCGFIESAKTEAIDNILAMAQLKAEGRIQKILVTGCLAQRYQEEILQEMPEVDGVLGTGSYFDVANAVGQVLSGKRYKRFDDINADQSEDGRILTTPEYYAYLKIAEGCDNHCAYCIIPKLRGKLRSRPIEELVKEAEQLAADGVKELIVVAQDTSRYGLDLYGERKLAELLRQLCRIDGLVWIRVHYLYPDEMSQELIDVLANEPKIVKYLDIPIQHINDDILRRMNRRGNGEYVKELFTKLRREIPGLVLRTSLITGLPGEGEAEFAQLCDFLKEYKLERVGAFAFSPEEGTRAAEMEYPDTEIARQRADMVAEIQSRIMDDYNESCIGKTMQVLCRAGAWQRRDRHGTSAARPGAGEDLLRREDPHLPGGGGQAPALHAADAAAPGPAFGPTGIVRRSVPRARRRPAGGRAPRRGSVSTGASAAGADAGRGLRGRPRAADARRGPQLRLFRNV